MQSAIAQAPHHDPQMTLAPPCPSHTYNTCSSISSPAPSSFATPLPPAVSSPSVASSPPLTSHIAASHLTSISNLREDVSSSTLFHHPMVETTSLGDTTNLQAHKQAALANKLRLSKVLDPQYERTSLGMGVGVGVGVSVDVDDGRSDIRVLSPSLVNSQVLSKTRPLSPSPPPQSQR